MNKTRHKIKYLISIILMLFIGIISLTSTSSAFSLKFNEFKGNGAYACMQPGGHFHSILKGPDKLEVTFSYTYTYDHKELVGYDPPYGQPLEEGQRRVPLYEWKQKEVTVTGNGPILVQGLTITNKFGDGGGGWTDSSHGSDGSKSDSIRSVAYVLRKNSGWKGAEQSWIWANLGTVSAALGTGSSNLGPITHTLGGSSTASIYSVHDPRIININAGYTIEPIVGAGAKVDYGEPYGDIDSSLDHGLEDDYTGNWAQEVENADGYESGGLGKYLKETKVPYLTNTGANPVRSNNAVLVGPFRIDYDDTNKSNEYEDIEKTGEDPAGVSKIKSMTIEYADGSQETATVVQGGVQITDFKNFEKNTDFYVRNTHPEKEVVNLHIELEKWTSYFCAEAFQAPGDESEIDDPAKESKEKDAVNKAAQAALDAIKNSASQNEANFTVKDTSIDGDPYTPYTPQNLLHITNKVKDVGTEEWNVSLDIPVEINKGNIHLQKKGNFNGQEEPLEGIKFKVYCDPCGYIKSISGRTIQFTGSLESAMEFTTGSNGTLDIPNLFAGEDYTYKLIETSATDTVQNHYYKDRFRISEASGYTLGHEGTNNYCTVENIKIPGAENIVIKNDRTSGDIIIDKVDPQNGTKLKGAKFKIQLVTSEVRGDVHDLNTSGWLKPVGSVGNYDYTNMLHNEYIEQGDGSNAGEFETDENGHLEIKGVINGTYQIYETKGDWGYDIEGQHGDEHDYDIDKKWVKFAEVIVVENGNSIINEELHNDITRGNLEIEKSDYTYKDEIKLEGAKFKIFLENLSQCDRGKDIETSGWLRSGGDFFEKELADVLTTEDDAGVYITDASGKIKITGIPNGTYHIYEVETSSGYNILEQDGYDSSKNWVDFGTIVVDSYGGQNTGENDTKQRQSNVNKDRTFVEIENRKILNQKDGLTGFVWVDGMDINKEGITEETYDSVFAQDDETFSGINITLKNANGERIATTVTGNGGRYNITKWDEDVDKKLHVDPEKDELYYWDLVNSYIEFEYNNVEYVCVNPFENGSASVESNSKAQEDVMTLEELNDSNLNLGYAITKQNGEGNKSHLEIMNTRYNSNDSKDVLSQYGLTAYYNVDNYIVEHINLGLWKKLEPTYNVREDIQYSKVKIRGYTYTYDYGESGEHGQLTVDDEPDYRAQLTANFQEGARTYGAKVYPSDIAYTKENPEDKLLGDKMEMYVVYKISITNTTTTRIPEIYTEEALFLDTLLNTYDSTRFEISDANTGDDKKGDVNYKGSEYFASWSDIDNTEVVNDGIHKVVNYDLNDSGIQKTTTEGHKLSDGIKAGETKSVYIQYKVRKDFLDKMLNREDIEQQMSYYASKTHTDAYHVYYRNDNLWNGGEPKYLGDGADIHRDINRTIQSLTGQYLHRSLNKKDESASLMLVISLADTRTIKGTIYEDLKENNDEITTPSEVHEAVGNGIIDNTEENRVEHIKIELIDAEECEKIQSVDPLASIEPTLIYGDFMENGTYGDRGFEAITYANNDGTYEFAGVVPGLYYLRFTYPDGETILVDKNGNKIDDINTNDYKSTIINTTEAGNLIQDAMETSDVDMKSYLEISKDAQEAEIKDLIQHYTEWYKYMDRNTYNIASDDFLRRNSLGKYEYLQEVDSEKNSYTTVKESEGADAVKDYEFKEVWSYTPYFSITIENTEAPKATVSFNENNSHQWEYTGFNLGLIKTPITDITIDKIITSIELTDSVGGSLSQRNPTEPTQYVTALDNIAGGSKYSRVEMLLEEIYGSSIEATYTITLTNLSEQDFIEDEASGNFGYYFKYGIKDYAMAKQTTITEVLDLLDPDYDLKQQSMDEFVTRYSGTLDTNLDKVTANGVLNTEDIYKTWVNYLDGKDQYVKYLSIRDFSPFEAGAVITTSYTASSKLQENMDLLFENDANIVSFKMDTGSTLRTGYNWERYTETDIVVSPDTGGDKRHINYIVITVGLVALAIGIVVIKKVILK